MRTKTALNNRIFTVDQLAAVTRIRPNGGRSFDIARRTIGICGRSSEYAFDLALKDGREREAINHQLIAGDDAYLQSLGITGELRDIFSATPKLFSEYRFLGCGEPVEAESLELAPTMRSLRTVITPWRLGFGDLLTKPEWFDDHFGTVENQCLLCAELLFSAHRGPEHTRDISSTLILFSADRRPISKVLFALASELQLSVPAEFVFEGVVGLARVADLSDLECGQEFLEISVSTEDAKQFILASVPGMTALG